MAKGLPEQHPMNDLQTDSNASESATEIDYLERGARLLSEREKALVRFVRQTFEPGLADRSIRFLQRNIGSIWIEHCTRNIRNVHGLSRLPAFEPGKSYILVSNHRSFFDLYTITAYLVYRDILPHRLLFPVRAGFFYDRYEGLAVNGIMSFFAMYPPIFRDRKRLRLNEAALDEVARLARNGGYFIGLHPEGMRNLGDPYELLPAKYGVGQVIARAPEAVVIPAFINGLNNDLPKQVKGNFDKTGDRIHIVFGDPIDFREERSARIGRKQFQRMSERCMQVIRELSKEERAIRERLSR
jgi:1-acyl-sn-glycerol-3-phosphate acyltransferase